MKKKAKIKAISVSDLCAYADDPTLFCQLQGKPQNLSAAHFGTLAHQQLAGEKRGKPIHKISKNTR